MIETKSWRLVASQEQAFIDKVQCFGWTVKSSSDYISGSVSAGGWTVSDKAVKITCTRDTEMPYYNRLRELWDIYERVDFSEPRPLSVMLAILGILCYIIPGIIYIVVKKKKLKKWRYLMNTQAKPALAEAKRLMQMN